MTARDIDDRTSPRIDRYLPLFEQRRLMLAACGFKPAPAEWGFQIPVAATRKAESWFAPGAIHFSINASTPMKEWPLDNWIGLGRELLASDPALQLVATGSASAREQQRVRSLAGALGNRVSTPPAGLPIAELAAVLQRCRLHVGADSGVLHLAVAVGAPTVSVFREYADASAWMPVGPAHRVLTEKCVCANNPVVGCVRGIAECLARITAAQVATAVRDALSQPPTS